MNHPWDKKQDAGTGGRLEEIRARWDDGRPLTDEDGDYLLKIAGAAKVLVDALYVERQHKPEHRAPGMLDEEAALHAALSPNPDKEEAR